jgi:predicted GIY-YIG superfamily endonuclease
MVGIYKITNPESKSYIGLSKDIEKRFQSHKGLQFHGNNKLRESLTKYGGDSHLFEILEEINIFYLNRSEGNALLRKRERYWINLYKTFENGLNENRGGSGCGSHTTESKQKISESLKGKPKPIDFGEKRKKWQHTEEWKEKVRKSPRCPILMYDLEDNLVQEFPNQQLAADYLGVKKQAIWNVLNGYINKKSGNRITQVRGYKFVYKSLYV